MIPKLRISSKRLAHATVGAGLFLLSASTNSYAAVIDNINGNFLPPFLVFDSAIQNVGWNYTPTFSYNLTGVASYFEPVPNASAASRTVTVVVESSPGGPVLASGTVAIGNAGGAQGVTFSTLQLTAGQTYFVGFENVAGLGLNIVDWFQGVNGPVGQQPAGTVNLNGWYSGATAGNDFSTFTPQQVGGQLQVFSAPILSFSGTPISTGVPEPSTWAMMLIGFAGLGFAGYRKRREREA